MKKIIVLLLALALLLPCLSGCQKQTGEYTYTIWLYTAQDTAYYSTYEENPVLNYLLQREYAGQKINLEFQVPASGQAQNNYQTMLAGGDYPTLMQNSVADAAPVMLENGYILDITDYVKEYMPNYYALIQSVPELKESVVFNIDGEERILAINTVSDQGDYVDFGGMCYRRDWIVKYGTNPSTEAAFTGGFNSDDVDDWSDDVMFPSWYDAQKKAAALAIDPTWDGTEPFYISDWEWMFEIFDKAMAAEGIDDGYCVSMYYPGYTWAGGLCSCFGEGGIIWYADTENQVQFGGSSESTRAYFTCLNTWYNNGWLDETFNERVSDAFYQIDAASVRQGKVGMWCGVKGDLGGRIDLEDGGYTDGIFVSGCSYPVNDVYGTEECKYVAPRVMNIDTSVVSTGFYVMTGADEQDLAPLFTFLDSLYAGEGAVLRSLGMSAEQLAEDGVDTSFYEEYGLMDGAYTIDENGKYVISDVIVNDSGSLSAAASLDKLPGLDLVKNVDQGYAETLEQSLKSWIRYSNSGRIWGSTAMLNASTEDSDTCQKALTKVLNYMEANAYKYIKGEKSLEGSDWDTWCTALNKFKVENVSEVLKKYLDLYPIAN